MNNVILINSSKRKKNTYMILKEISEILNENDISTEIINLHDYNIKFCNGCEVCVKNGGCPINDDTESIMKKISDSDGIVIGTPVYLNNMSGILKTFIDRTCSWFHRSEVYQKPVLIAVNTRGSGIKNTKKSIDEVLIQWGVNRCGVVSRTGITMKNSIEKNEVAPFIDAIKKEGKGYKPSMKEIFTYNMQRSMANNLFQIDRDYWETKGWMDKPYFPESNSGIIKSTFGELLYRFMCKVIKPIDKNKI